MNALLPSLFVVAALFATSSPTIAKSPEETVGDKILWKELNDGKVVVLPLGLPLLSSEPGDDEDDFHAACAAIIIEAPVKAVWDVIADKEAAPDYIESLQSAKILEEHPDYVLIEQVMKLGPLPKVTYVVKHMPLPPHEVKFERHSGDLESIKGFWKFMPIGDGSKCLVIYRLSLKPGFFVPNFVIKRSLKKSLPEALEAVRDQVAARALAAKKN
ncbi:MAG: SRPBCC family protein [Verrucomicrobiae bacterium]|nr:SRPBCC family protein [Verrucomicrobiae bacterium]